MCFCYFLIIKGVEARAKYLLNCSGLRKSIVLEEKGGERVRRV